ncbi:MAG: hypothetical protein PWP08_1846 [Methanofollis sp.]|nr:hypothetical protein [Methanofollis sp.]
MGNMARKSRAMGDDSLSSSGVAVGDDGCTLRGGRLRREVCDLCGDRYAVTDGEKDVGLCPACRRETVRVCPYCERSYRTDAWPHDLCPECYEEQEWHRGCGGDEYEDNFDRLEDY